jgi:citrate lyase subunit beta/citryl-CoA lyase
MARRTVLFAPGDEPEKCRKAADTGADVVVFDLEDGVGPDAKEAARENVRTLLDEVETDSEVCVRVNGRRDLWERDLVVTFADAVPDAVMVPKAAGVGDVTTLAEALEDAAERRPLLAVVESAVGVLEAQSIAAAGPTDALIFGAEDLAGDVGSDPAELGGVTTYAREHVLLAARAGGVDAIDTVYPAYDDYEGLGEAARRAVVLGYDGKLDIHPRQVPVIHEAFVPKPERVEWARRVLAASEDADGGVSVVDGEMIDAPQVSQAERILERAEDEG